MVPSFYAARRWWSSDEIAAIASAWHTVFDERGIGACEPCAAALPSTAEGAALFVALSARGGVGVLLSGDPATWPVRSALFEGMRLALPPALAHHADIATRLGFVPIPLPPPRIGEVAPAVHPLRAPGFVFLTSGSTGTPKPVYRPTPHLLASAAARSAALGLGRGEGIVCGVPFSSGQGVMQLVTAMQLGGAFGVLGPTDHREALATLARPEFGCWRATPHFADVLGRCSLTGAAVAPRLCVISSSVHRAVFDRFRSRFGTPLRQAYSSSETGAIAVDAGSPDDVVPGSVGHPLPGVQVSIGDDPEWPVVRGEVGRVWVRSPWQMAGYGVPPVLERPGDRNGWWPTRDLGLVDPSGRMTLAGRMDDAVRTRDGRVVNFDAVAKAIGAADCVRDVLVVRIHSPSGPAIGALVVCEGDMTVDALRERLGASVPAWALPRRIEIVPALPRLPTGKADRLAGFAVLSGQAPS